MDNLLGDGPRVYELYVLMSCWGPHVLEYMNIMCDCYGGAHMC